MVPTRFSGPTFRALLAGSAVLISGCGGGQTAEQALDKALKRDGETKQRVYPLAGRITIDGTTSQFDPREPVVIMLIEAQKLDAPRLSHRFVQCDQEGRFAFSTYALDDGVRPGRYIVAIAKLRCRGPHIYIGPDQLHNLFNDPEKNAGQPQFQIDHNGPGKTDYEFPLTVAGVEPIENPGPHAVTSIP